MAKDDTSAETGEPPDPKRRDGAVTLAENALADATRHLKTAAGHAGDRDGTRGDLDLFSEEARDVYTRVAALGLRFSAEAGP